MPASIGRIWRIAVIATVTAGLKWAPDTTASAWISANRMNACVRPITDQSWNGCVAGRPGWAAGIAGCA
jgi:hypothetical protein